MSEGPRKQTKKIEATFFRYENGSEPVRVWLLENLSKDERRIVGGDIRTVELEWPIGPPLVKKVGKVWEVRSEIQTGWARVFFVVDGGRMYLLHGVVKKSKNVSRDDTDVTLKRLGLLMGQRRDKKKER
jgi:phage-related protein